MNDRPRILLVDDDPQLLHGASRLLQQAGFQDLVATNGEEGLHLAVDHRPELILLHVVLPDVHVVEICWQLKADSVLPGSLLVLLLCGAKGRWPNGMQHTAHWGKLTTGWKRTCWLTQALGELVENAITFTPCRGQVPLEATIAKEDGSRWVTVAVRDTGPGIPAEEQDRILGQLFRGSSAAEGGILGTSLGLSIVQEIVRARWTADRAGRIGSG